MGSMRSMTIVKNLPFLNFFPDINIICVFNELIKLCLICRVRSLDLTIQVWCSRLDINMSNAQILTISMELRLKFMAIISLNGMYTEGKPF
jgi:hypothetical protein